MLPSRLHVRLLGALALSSGFMAHGAATLDMPLIEQLSNRLPFQEAKLSPDGKHLAWAVLKDNERTIRTLRLDNMAVVGGARLGGESEFGDFFWANNERLVAEVLQRHGWQEEPVSYGELYAFDLDGSKGKVIYGFRADERQTGSQIKKADRTFGWAELIDPLIEDERYILISSTPMREDRSSLAKVARLNVDNGVSRSTAIQSPVPDATFLTKSDHQVALVYGTDKEGRRQVYLRDPQQRDWQPLGKSNLVPLAFNASGKGLYLLGDIEDDKSGLYRYNLADGSYKNLYTDKVVDITNVMVSQGDKQVYALRVDDGLPSYLLVNSKHPEAQIFKNLLASFPGQQVSIVSRTPDDSKYVLTVSSDVDPGSIYLFDKPKNKLYTLYSYREKLDKQALVPTEPFNFKSSDGLSLHGYYTAPREDRAGKSNKLVVLVHGGPYQVRDYWGFNPQVHLLSQHGYGVLRVNFRGSAGYGTDFELAGHRQWGDAIQRDIAEAVDWAISNKGVAKDKICIMGASFGGYSALINPIRFPGKYQCAVANAGVYDLAIMGKSGDIPKLYYGNTYLTEVLGSDHEKLKALSPAHQADKLSVPVLLAHGDRDERAPKVHFEAMVAALNKADKPHETYLVKGEGHGFANPENRALYYQKVLNFLDKHLAD